MDSLKIRLLFYLSIIHVTLQDTSQQDVKSRFDNIIKPTNDKRDYRGLVLNNEMKVILISDPKTDKSAASINVNVGGMKDPPKVQGLAHFLEHMLIASSKKYPATNTLKEYCSKYGGKSNAYTNDVQTGFYFDINSENLEGILDRFAQFFIEPLFDESTVEGEIHSVASEYNKNANNDTVRMWALHKFTADLKHPYSNFVIGSNESLNVIPKQKGIHVRKEVMEFYEKWYSANIMTLSVLGKESLDDLENMVKELFNKVPNKNITVPVRLDHPFNKKQFQHKWYAVPASDIDKILIYFSIPNLKEHFRSAPGYYVLYLLQQEGEGSLNSVLKTKGWITKFTIEHMEISEGVNFLELVIVVTKEGLEHADDIITLMFQYINMIRKEKPAKWIFDEYSSIKRMNFNFQVKKSPIDYVQETASNLLKYPIEEILSGPNLYTDWKPDLINLVTSHLTSQRIRIIVQSKVYANITTEVEPWFKVKFKKEKISASLIEKWKNAGYNLDLKLPAKNQFIPTNFDLKKDNFPISRYPTVIKETPLMKVWYKKDDEFLLPEAYLNFQMKSKFAYNNPEIKLEMLVKLLNQFLTKHLSAANMAGLNWQLDNDELHNMHLSIGGFDSKQFSLLEEIMNKIMNFTIDEEVFDFLKKQKIQDLKTVKLDDRYIMAKNYLKDLLGEKNDLKEVLIQATDALTVKSVEDFKSQMFATIHVECLIHGNVKKDEALKIASLVESKLNTAKEVNKENIILPVRKKVPFKTYNLKQGSNYLYEIENIPGDSSATIVYYQVGLATMGLRMLNQLFTVITNEPCRTTLRYTDKLGYISYPSLFKVNEVHGYAITVDSDKDSIYVLERINSFIENIWTYIKNMPVEEFDKYKESTIQLFNEKPATISELSNQFWDAISTQKYNFDQKDIDRAFIQTVTKDQILHFYGKFIKTGSNFRKKLILRVVPTAKERIVDSNDKAVTKIIADEKVFIIKNKKSFRNSHSFYPSLNDLKNTTKH